MATSLLWLGSSAALGGSSFSSAYTSWRPRAHWQFSLFSVEEPRHSVSFPIEVVSASGDCLLKFMGPATLRGFGVLSICEHCQDMLNDGVQILTFVLHGDYGFAVFMLLFVGFNAYVTVEKVAKHSTLNRFDVLGEARLCLARKVPTRAWGVLLGNERLIEAPGTGLIGPYGASLLQLTPFQAASALYGLYSSAKAMAEGRLDLEAGRGLLIFSETSRGSNR